MEGEKLLAYFLDSYPYPVVFVGCDHVIPFPGAVAGR
jgi:hypothetical protein